MSSVKFVTRDYASLITIQSAHFRDLLVLGLQDVACPVMAAETGIADHLPGIVWAVGMWAWVSPAPAKQTSVNIQHLQLLQAQWFRTLGSILKPCRHPARPRQISVASLVAAEGCHVLVK